jgi:4-amino-4-deoxychorismate lyase
LAKNFLINGDTKNSLSPFDRGLAFGDGIFRTLLVEDKQPKLWKMQYHKISNDLRSMEIKPPSQKILLEDIQKLFPSKGIFIAKIIVTRGESHTGYDFKKGIKPTRVLLKIDFNKKKYDLLQKGVTLTTTDIKASSSPYASIKHLNRLENVLARKGLNKDSFDAIMLDRNGNVCDCARSSLFIRYGSDLFTASNKGHGIHGVTKKIIEENIKRLNLSMNYSPLTIDQLKKADEIIVSNSIFGALQVIRFKNKKWNKGALANSITSLLNETN